MRERILGGMTSQAAPHPSGEGSARTEHPGFPPGADDEDAARSWVYRLAAADPDGELVDRRDLDAQDVAQIDALMRALGDLRAAEKALAEASMRYMDLGETDMRAIQHLIATQHRGEPATAGRLAAHLGISSASTTKLLDRLERAGHVHREPHPTDRRALVVRVDPETRGAAMRTMGAHQARRIHAVRRLSGPERDLVTRFLDDMTAELSLDGVEWAQGPGEDAPGR